MSGEALFWGIRQPVDSAAEKAVLWELCNLANKDRGHVAWPSLQWLCRHCGTCETTLRKTIRSLARRGLVEIRGSRIRRSYRLCLEAGIQPDAPADDTRARHGNTGASRGNTHASHRNTRAPRGQSYKYPDKDKAGAPAPAPMTQPGRTPRLTGAAAVLAEEAALWTRRLGAYRQDGFWPAAWGPSPGERGCIAPRSVLVQFGLAGQDAAAGSPIAPDKPGSGP